MKEKSILKKGFWCLLIAAGAAGALLLGILGVSTIKIMYTLPGATKIILLNFFSYMFLFALIGFVISILPFMPDKEVFQRSINYQTGHSTPWRFAGLSSPGERSSWGCGPSVFLVGLGAVIGMIYCLFLVADESNWKTEVYDLNKIVFLNNKSAYFLEAPGTKDLSLVKTTDAGLTWHSVNLDSGYLYAPVVVQFLTENIGLALQGSSHLERLRKTTDSGANWIYVLNDPSEEWNSMRQKVTSLFFLDEKTGWVSSNYELYRTHDGGSTWKIVKLPKVWDYEYMRGKGQKVQRIKWYFFTSKTRGVIISQGGFVFRTENGGKNWRDVSLQEKGDVSLSDAYFINDLVGWLLTSESKIFRTKDGGDTWDLPNKREDHLSIKKVYFIDQKRGWAINGSKNLMRTMDGGIFWQNQKIGTFKGVKDIHFFDKMYGWAIGPGVMLVTFDGGESWQNRFSYKSVELKGSM